MSLEQIAQMMWKEAEKFGDAEEFLSGGLELALRREGGEWTLSMRRKGEQPSPKEQAIIRRFFKVPQGIKCEYEQSAGGYYIVKLAWADADEAPPPRPEYKQSRLM